MVLSNICQYVKDKVETNTLSKDTYISTENMLSNNGGITKSSNVPVGKAIKVLPNDILISNIRPYFKKIWKAKFRCGCSNDVLCIRANDDIDSTYLYYLLSQDSFFDYVMTGANGSKMPRGDRSQIMNWEVNCPSIELQHKIANILSSLDAKIENNNKINANLEAQAAALFKSWFVDFEPFKDGEFVESELGMIPKGWKVGTLGEIAKISKMSINPAKSPDCLYSHYSLPAFDNGKLPQKQLGSEIKSNKFTFQPFSILLSKLNPDIKRIWFVDTLEENPICSTEFIPVLPNLSRDFAFTYLCVSNEHYYTKLLSGVTGATNSHQRLKPEDVINLQIPINESVFEMFAKTVTSLLIQINANIYQNKSVAQIRDTLLPKLMSGEIDLDNISI